MESDALHFKILANKLVEIDIAGEDVSPNGIRRTIAHSKRGAEFIEHFEGKKGDLAFIILFEIEVAITPNSAPGDTFNFRNFDRWIRVGWAFMMPDKVVSMRNVEVTDFHSMIITWESRQPMKRTTKAKLRKLLDRHIQRVHRASNSERSEGSQSISSWWECAQHDKVE